LTRGFDRCAIRAAREEAIFHSPRGVERPKQQQSDYEDQHYGRQRNQRAARVLVLPIVICHLKAVSIWCAGCKSPWPTSASLKEKAPQGERVRVPGDRDHQFQTIVIIHSRGS
jgi:hypothetical protein